MYHLKIKTTLLLPFWFGCLYFFFLPYCSDWDFQTVLNRHGEDNHFCLIPAFRGTAFSLSLLSRMLSVGLLYMTFIMLSYVLFIRKFLRVFNPERMLHFQMFCLYYRDDTTFNFHIYWFAYIEKLLLHWNKSHLIMVIDLFNILLNSVC